jgi:4-phytase/acid phosphatase
MIGRGVAFGVLLGALAGALGLVSSLHAQGPDGAVLERIVVVARHGVRSPTKTPEALSQYSAQAWPQWPVPVGELTPHGAADVRIMGAWLRADYARMGLWPATGCPSTGAVYAWADGADQRTRASGDAVLAGAFPGCGLSARHGPEGAKDPLFDAVSSGACPIDADQAKAAVLAAVKGDLDRPSPDYEAGKAALAEVLDPAIGRQPCADAAGRCFLNGHNTLSVRNGDVRLDGPLATASTLSESLLLEYAQGMPRDAVGWGRAGTSDQIAAVMGLHNIESDLMRRTPYLADHNAALLARAVADAVDGRPALPQQGAAGTKLVLIAGHDTNLANLAGVLGLDWTLAGQPDKTPPDASLVFEVWRKPSGEQVVKTALVYQTLDQLRDATVLDAAHPAGRVALKLAACTDGPDGVCSVGGFRRVIEAAVPAECKAVVK